MGQILRAVACAAAVIGAAAAVPGAAWGQKFPVRPVHLVVPFPPGGPTDIIGRLVAGKMQEIWGQPVIVDNKAGATGPASVMYHSRRTVPSSSEALKSSSASFGALTLSTMCRQLEQQVTAGELSEAAGRLTAITAEFEKAREALTRMRPALERATASVVLSS